MTRTIYVRLLNEGTDVRRPTKGREVEEGMYEVLPTPDYDPSDEEWEFPPGSHVRLERRDSDQREYLIAIEPKCPPSRNATGSTTLSGNR